MIKFFDFKIFGNGRGIAQPFHDGQFYWLVDTFGKQRSGKNGQFYMWSGWYGAQLQSFQWTHPRAGDRRVLGGKEFRVFRSTRRGLRVEVAWTLTGLPKDLNDANAMLREVKATLASL